ncbi:MAG: DUF4255 domain-containing protein [Bacteroidetes bacterium]|nr:DUF4255 domain-containing protein [Bacteroidota bacterium]
MINDSLQFATAVLDQFLKRQFSLDESGVVLNRVVEQDGSVPASNQNKLVLSLINIDNETNRPYYTRNETLPDGNYSDISLSERFNLYLLFSANFDDYAEGLKFLNAAILFFQVHTFLDVKTYPQMPAGFSKIEFDIEKLTYHQMHSLWTSMGAKYLPSVIYRMRLITIKGNDVTGFTPAVTGTINTTQP